MTERVDPQGDARKASFKLDLIETANADPVLEASDLKLIAAYASVMTWPKREAWLSGSRARAMTGLSERQVSKSRARLVGKNVAKHAYLHEVRRNGLTTVFRIDNPFREKILIHISQKTEYLRERQRDRQVERRRVQRAVLANSARTKEDLSQSPRDCDVPEMDAGNIPSPTPQNIALKEESPSEMNSYAKQSAGW